MSHPQCPLCAHEEPCSCKELKDCLEAFMPTLIEYLRDRFDEHVADGAASLAWEAAMKWIANGKVALMDQERRRAFLCGAARNLAYGILRRQARSILGRAKPLKHDPRADADPLQILVVAEETALLRESLTELDDGDRCLLKLRHVDGATFAQLADRLGCSEATAWRRVEAASERLRKIFHSKARKKFSQRAS